MQKISGCLFADNALYDSEKNVWVRIDEENTLATIGIDTVLSWLSGPFTSVSFKPVGTTVEKGKSLGSAEGPRHFDTIKSPLTCKIVELNSVLKDNPTLLNRDPYGAGWFVRVTPLKLSLERDGLLPIGPARIPLARKIAELKVKCFDALPDYEMLEVGSECTGVLVKLEELIRRSPIGTVVHLVSDEPTAEIELIAWSERTGQEILETLSEGRIFHFIIRKAR